MSDRFSSCPLFVFDMDSTITKCESLPVLAREIHLEDEMRQMTERSMEGLTCFQTDFPKRASLLKPLSVSRGQELFCQLPLHEELAAFIRENAARCLIMTGNLDIWITGLLEKLSMTGRCLCSHASVKDDHLDKVLSVMDKAEAAKTLPHPFVAVGDGDNDIGMLAQADFGIGFEGVRHVSDHLRKAADTVIENEADLCRLLRSFL